jgi:hypothetical protein
MNKKFEEQALISIKLIRDWNGLTLLNKLLRINKKPSPVDYRLVNTWIINMRKKDD